MRSGIFIFYDSEGIADEYIFYLLNSLKDFLDYLMIVCNGKVDAKSRQRFEKYANVLLVRENRGYDAGAYKEAIYMMKKNGILNRTDELLLFNDTFYGPLYPWNDFFSFAEKSSADYIGITMHKETVLEDGEILPEHIQAYFMLIKSLFLHSEEFERFWKNLKEPRTYEEAVHGFEIPFSVMCLKSKYRYEAYTNLDKLTDIKNKNVIPYLYYNMELIEKQKMPTLKIKAVQFQNVGFCNTLDAIEYIKNNLAYDMSYISEHIKRKSNEKTFFSVINFVKLNKFVLQHNNIYIYGNGKYGERVQRYFKKLSYKFNGIVVSTKENDKKNGEILYSTLRLEKNDGIIIALGEKNAKEVYEVLKKDLDSTQILMPDFDVQEKT
jgi:rhamnosyltransferase